MNLLVVGGSGYIGRNFLAAFDAGAEKVVATYRSDERFPDFLHRLNSDVRPLRCDLLEPSNDFSEYDVALYLAGNANHGWAGQNPHGDLNANGVAMTRFLDTFRGRLVLLSSAAVYLGQEGLVSPATPTSPLFPYAISKLASELYARWAESTGRLAECTILRLYYAYGPGEEARRLIRRALTEFGLRGSRAFEINGDGRSLMGPMHVSDLAAALRLAVGSSETGVFDLMGERAYTVAEIVTTAASVVGVDVELSHRPSEEAHLGFFSDPSAFANAFGFKPRFGLATGMRDYLEELRREAGG